MTTAAPGRTALPRLGRVCLTRAAAPERPPSVAGVPSATIRPSAITASRSASASASSR